MGKYDRLIQAGPFRGIDASTSQVDEDTQNATFSSNVDTQRFRGGMSTARGRVIVGTLSGGVIVNAMQQQSLTGAIRNSVFSLTNNTIIAFNQDIGTQVVVTNGIGFSEASPFGSQMFTNSGQQLFATGGTIINQAVPWQFDSAANSQAYQFTVTAGPPFLAGQTYFYAVANIYTINALGIAQQSSPHGAFLVNGVYPNTVGPLPPATDFINFTTTTPAGNIWQGTLFGGTVTWDTAFYRQSTGQPVWLLVASSKTGLGGNYTLLVNGVTWNDSASDAAIAANPQLNLYQDVPPVSSTNLGVIFSFKGRMWNFVVQQNANTNGIAQCQLWYSTYGVGYAFNGAYQVLLVNTEGTVNTPGYTGFGDHPVAAAPLSSVTVLYKSESMAFLWGDDQTNFIIQPVGGDGTDCIAPASAVPCGETVATHLGSQGIFTCDGYSPPQYISEDIRVLLDQIPTTDQRNATSFYANRSYYISFPATGVTYVYYFPSKTWRSLPYALSAVISEPHQNAPVLGGTTQQRFNEILGSRPGTATIDAWESAETDLGQPITATWITALNDSGKIQSEANYQFVGLLAPIQPGVTAQIQLSVYNMSRSVPQTTTYPPTGSMDLGAKVWHPFIVPQGSEKGYLATLTITLTNAANATAPAQIFQVVVDGTQDREWNITATSPPNPNN